MAFAVSPAASSDPLEVVEVGALNEAEAGYVRAARAANTLRGYRSDWAEWCAWSKSEGYPELPATAEGISRYLSFLAGCGAKVGTMSRRLSGIRFAHKMRDLPDPTATARVIAVWEGIRRTPDTSASRPGRLPAWHQQRRQKVRLVEHPCRWLRMKRRSSHRRPLRLVPRRSEAHRSGRRKPGTG